MLSEECKSDIKSRKGSCSTISSPNQAIFDPQETNTKQIPKHKKVKKEKKLRKYSSLTDEKLNIISQNDRSIIIKKNQNMIFHMIKDICSLFNFSIDTYLVCLKIVRILKFDGESVLCSQVAATIGFMVQKLYESCKLTFNNIQNWSGFALTKETFAETQAAILIGLDFQLPSIHPEYTPQEIMLEIKGIQSFYLRQFQI